MKFNSSVSFKFNNVIIHIIVYEENYKRIKKTVVSVINVPLERG